MGGNVFATPARRLSTEQLLSLLEHTKSALGSFFSGMEITRFFGEKTTHGDLDVLCGLWSTGTGWKGSNQEGVLDPRHPKWGEGEAAKCQTFGKEEEREWTTGEVKLFCEVLGEKVGAVKWEKHGYEVSYAVPCSIIDKETSMTGEEDFYQIDLLLVQPTRLGFSVMTQSYGVTALLYAVAVRRMSSSFTCHNDRFVIRYSPYQGLKAIEVELTSDPLEFMKWAGLDPDRFEKGFETEKEYWLWLTCLSNEDQGANDEERQKKYEALMQNRFPQGWSVMAKKKSGEKDSTKMPKGHTKVRLEVMARFRDWLKTTIYVPKPTPPPSVTESEADPQADGTLTKTQGTLGEVSNTADQMAALAITAPLLTSPIESPTVPSNPKEQNLVDPDKPRELSYTAHSGLEYFGKVSEWTSLFETRKQEAKIMADRQARNNKERAEMFNLAKVDRSTDQQTSVATPAAPLQSSSVSVTDPRHPPVVGKAGEGRVMRPEERDEGVSL